MKDKLNEKIIAILFLIIIYGIFIITLPINISNLSNSFKGIKKNGMTFSNIEEAIDLYEQSEMSLYTNNRILINCYGLIQNLLGKKEVKNFEILKAENGQLYMQLSEKNIDREAVSQIKELNRYCTELGISFLFIQLPYKNFSNVQELQTYGTDSTEDDFDWFLEQLSEQEVPYLDLRKNKKINQHYCTDHHWTVETSFYAAKETANAISDLHKYSIWSDAFNRDNYDIITYENSFLGSYGIKIGEYYARKDDFSILFPKFETRLNYQHLIDGKVALERSGTFEESFIDKSVLENEKYYNKYNSLLNGGYVENIIYNEQCENDTKVLLIAHSYGRPLAQYLSLGVKELRYLDPQNGRYNDSILEYINEYQPDVVIDMYNWKMNLDNQE